MTTLCRPRRGRCQRAETIAPTADDDMIFNDEDDEVPPRPTTKKRATPAAATLATKLPPLCKVESSLDIEMADEDEGPKPPRPKNAKAASSSAKDEDDEDSGDDLVRRALEKGKGKATQAGIRNCK
jgi:hypothetical protein